MSKKLTLILSPILGIYLCFTQPLWSLSWWCGIALIIIVLIECSRMWSCRFTFTKVEDFSDAMEDTSELASEVIGTSALHLHGSRNFENHEIVDIDEDNDIEDVENNFTNHIDSNEGVIGYDVEIVDLDDPTLKPKVGFTSLSEITDSIAFDETGEES